MPNSKEFDEFASKFTDGPIPGENMTSDTKNYPWHRPPQHTDLDECIEVAFQRLTDEDNVVGLLTMIETGLPIVRLANAFVMSGIADGKWTPDIGLMLAGPVCHIMYLMAEGYGIPYEMGLFRKKHQTTKAFFDRAEKINAKKAQSVAQQVQEQNPDLAAQGEQVAQSPEAQNTINQAQEPPAAPAPSGFAGMAMKGNM